MTTSSKIIKSVHLILINSKKEILLQLRDNKPEIYYPGYWGLLGGSVEAGEKEIEALKREIKEEIGHKLKDAEYLGCIRKDNFKMCIFKTKTKLDVKKINLKEGQEVRYFSMAEVNNLHIIPLIKTFISKNRGKIWN